MKKNRNLLKTITLYTVLIIGALIMIFPFFYMITTAFKTKQELMVFPPKWLPNSFLNFDNFINALKAAPFDRFFINSLIVTFASTLVTSITTILGAFAFSRLKFKGREVIFALLLSLMMVPFEMLVITNYTTISKLRFIDSLIALIIPFTSSIFYTYILRNFFKSIPDALYYSARIDGASNWKYLWRIMVPIAKPSLFTIILLNAIASWNSFFWPMLVINSRTNRTLPLGLYIFSGEGGGDFELIMAGSTLIVLPMIILFLIARKHILNGVSRGGLKG